MNAGVREELVNRPTVAARWLRFGALEQACRQSDHALDAVVAALNARAAALGRATEPSSSRSPRPGRRAGSPCPPAAWPTSEPPFPAESNKPAEANKDPKTEPAGRRAPHLGPL